MAQDYSRLYINGEWISPSGKSFEVRSPVDGEPLARIPIADRNLVGHACEAASSASRKWRYTHHSERARLLKKVSAILWGKKEELARQIVREQGKPLALAKSEVETFSDSFRESAEDITRLESPVVPSTNPSKRIITIRQGLGVMAVITPWNYPFAVPSYTMAPALAAGNTVVLKPAEQTPLSAVSIFEAFHEAGLPSGVVNLVQGPGLPTGEALVENEMVDAVAFTGSTEIGRRIAEIAGRSTKHLLLEMGGNGPIVVMDDADMQTAVRATADACFTNAGQICTSGERILVHKEVHEKFVEHMVQEAKKVRVGDPFNPETSYGPLIDEALATKVDKHIADAQTKGAKIRSGGGRASGFPTRLYYNPTILDGVNPTMLINREETFGPVVPVVPVSGLDEALEVARTSDYGLTASIFTRDIKVAFRFAELMPAGTVQINSPSTYWDGRYPVGGVKNSGLGRVGGKYSLLEMSQMKTIVVDLA